MGYLFLREKGLNGKRVYFLAYEDFRIVLMVSISDKNTQQETIDKIKWLLPEYKIFVQKLAESI